MQISAPSGGGLRQGHKERCGDLVDRGCVDDIENLIANDFIPKVLEPNGLRERLRKLEETVRGIGYFFYQLSLALGEVRNLRILHLGWLAVSNPADNPTEKGE